MLWLRQRALIWTACAVALSSSAGRLLHAAPAQYVAAKVCGSCHPAQFVLQNQSAHANALFACNGSSAGGHFPPSFWTCVEVPVIASSFYVRAESLTRIFDAKDATDLPLEWAFGAGRQAVTFVTKVNQDWYVEHYSTYYSAVHSWGPTPGQSAIRPTSLATAAGLLYNTTAPDTGIAGCFECYCIGPEIG